MTRDNRCNGNMNSVTIDGCTLGNNVAEVHVVVAGFGDSE